MKTRNSLMLFMSIMGVLVLFRILIACLTPVFDPSEGRYAAICANMAASGDFLVPRFIHEGVFQSFDGKPPLVFQLGGLFCTLFGRTEFAVRLPALLAGFGMLSILFFCVRGKTDTPTARRAVAVCLTSVAFFATTGFCMTDLPLTFCVAGALLLEDRFNDRPSRALSLGVFALLGLGMLVKGPVALVLFGLPVFVDVCVNRRWRILRRHEWILGPILFLGIASPWYILMERQTPGFLKYFFINENILRFLVHDYGDKYGAGRETFRGMAAVWAIVVTLPWAPLALIRRVKERPGFLPLAILSITGFWCLTSRVPLTYLLPTVPLFAAWITLRTARIWIDRLLPAAAAICILALAGTLLTTDLTTSKLPGDEFKQMIAEHPSAHFSFVKTKHQPYSAEFYFGDRLHLGERPGDIRIERVGKEWKVVAQ